MSSQTTYFEFNIPAGNDLVNPLVDTNPNWSLLDGILHEFDTRSIANATETVVVGVHAISRLNTNTKFIKWIATANFTAGDTFTVDGNVVAASTPSGESLESNSYVTGSVVVGCLNADDSAMTVYVGGIATDSAKLGGQLPSYYATDSDMTAAKTDITNIKALDGTTSIATIGDGTITGAIASLNSDLTDMQKHTAGTVHELTYQEYTGYTAPSDGYIKAVISSSDASANYGAVLINNEVIINIRTVSAQTQSVFIKKGTTIRAGGEGTTLSQHYYFIPLV